MMTTRPSMSVFSAKKYVPIALAVACVTMLFASDKAHAQTGDPQPSQCIAIAQNELEAMPEIQFASFSGELPLVKTQSRRIAQDVTITYVTHSTYRIETPQGVSAATDYAGWAGPTPPNIATMNKAHSSHWTPNPDPEIKHVLQGWNAPYAGPISHRVVEGDLYVRNVTTDLVRYGMAEADANSIFIFETAGLCIAHLGHLHHALEDRHFAAIGRIDIVMIPVDGGLTLSHQALGQLVARLQPSILLPMHLRGQRIGSFISLLDETFTTEYLDGNAITVSLETLPKRPTLMVPQSLN